MSAALLPVCEAGLTTQVYSEKNFLAQGPFTHAIRVTIQVP